MELSKLNSENKLLNEIPNCPIMNRLLPSHNGETRTWISSKKKKSWIGSSVRVWSLAPLESPALDVMSLGKKQLWSNEPTKINLTVTLGPIFFFLTLVTPSPSSKSNTTPYLPTFSLIAVNFSSVSQSTKKRNWNWKCSFRWNRASVIIRVLPIPRYRWAKKLQVFAASIFSLLSKSEALAPSWLVIWKKKKKKNTVKCIKYASAASLRTFSM